MFCGANIRIIFHSASVVTIFFTCISIIFTLFCVETTKSRKKLPESICLRGAYRAVVYVTILGQQA